MYPVKWSHAPELLQKKNSARAFYGSGGVWNLRAVALLYAVALVPAVSNGLRNEAVPAQPPHAATRAPNSRAMKAHVAGLANFLFGLRASLLELLIPPGDKLRGFRLVDSVLTREELHHLVTIDGGLDGPTVAFHARKSSGGCTEAVMNALNHATNAVLVQAYSFT